MRLSALEYHQPVTLDAAVEVLAHHEGIAAPIAGGTELLLLMKLGLADHEHLVNLKRIPELAGIAVDGGALSIGALATHDSIASSQTVRETVPALAELCGSIANARVRNSGTLGGNLCFAEPRADPPVLLAALGAVVDLYSAHGARRLPVEAFILAPMTTALEASEILTGIRAPVRSAGVGCVRMAHGSHSLATAAVVLGDPPRAWVGHGGGMAPLEHTAALLASGERMPNGDTLDRALSADIAQMEIVSDIDAGEDYRRHLVAVAARRAVAQAFDAAEERRR